MIRSIFSELLGLFVDDEFLAVAILLLVLSTGILRYLGVIDPIATGILLVLGLPGILIIGVMLTLRRFRASSQR